MTKAEPPRLRELIQVDICFIPHKTAQKTISKTSHMLDRIMIIKEATQSHKKTRSTQNRDFHHD
jgi:hypothetical protein